LSIRRGSCWFAHFSALQPSLVVPEDRRARAVLDTVDQGRPDALAAIDQHRIAGGHPHHGRLASAQRHREHRLQVVIDAEAAGIFGNQRHADILGEPYRHQVLRELDAVAQCARAGRLAVEILRPPHAEPRPLVDLDRGIEDDA
jgi:hypothetical protein